ncbi:MAG TPA: response regulator [Polyangiaceae bacterium]
MNAKASKTIVIIDDDVLVLETARRLLERDGLRVFVYSEGYDATNFAARHQPDLVLMDVNMPFLSGDSLATLFKRHEQLQRVPLVLFSSNEEGALRRMARDIGASGYICKSEMGSGFSARILGLLEQRTRTGES